MATNDETRTIRSNYQAETEKIRKDGGLSPLGKQQAIARAWARANTELKRLGDANDAQRNQRQSTLERQLLGSVTSTTGVDAISLRDAQDRAAQIKDEDDAIAVLNRVHRTGDTMLGKAVLAEAIDQGWAEAANTWGNNNPAQGDALVELWEHRHKADNFGIDDWGYQAISKPAELQMLPDTQVYRIAEATTEATS